MDNKQPQHPYQLKFINAELKSDVVFYTIQVVNIQTKLSWSFTERYRNMLQLDSQMKQYVKQLPSFPAKKLFGNTDPQFISARKAALQNYFKTVLDHVEVEKIPPLKEFLTRGEPKQVREPRNDGVQIQQSAPMQQQQQLPFKQQQQVNKQKAIKSEYDKITNETNTKFIDLAFMMSAPEENDTKKKKFLYDQLKVDNRFTEVQRVQMKTNPDASFVNANPTLQSAQPEFFELLKRLEKEINKILEI